MKKDNKSKSGFVTIVGRPNVGKSTLLNAILHTDIAAVSAKPQTTRKNINGIVNKDNAQIVFLDTPGFHESTKELNKVLLGNIENAISDADIYCVVVEPEFNAHDEELLKKVIKQASNRSEILDRIILVVNKSDTILPASFKELANVWHDKFGINNLILISALKNEGVNELIDLIIKDLPVGEHFYGDEYSTTETVRDISAEYIREEVFNQMHQEIPYSTAVVIEKFDESKKPTHVWAAIILEKDSQKGMVIGKGGIRLKKIGTKARKRIEKLIGEQIFLKLFVKVDKDWTKNSSKLKEFI